MQMSKRTYPSQPNYAQPSLAPGQGSQMTPGYGHQPHTDSRPVNTGSVGGVMTGMQQMTVRPPGIINIYRYKYTTFGHLNYFATFVENLFS